MAIKTLAQDRQIQAQRRMRADMKRKAYNSKKKSERRMKALRKKTYGF